MRVKNRKGAISIMILLIGLVLFIVVAGLIAWKFNSFQKLLGGYLGNHTAEIKNDTIEKSKRAFCKSICRTCCQTKDKHTDCNERLDIQTIQVGEKEIPCSQVIECHCN